MGHRNKDDDHNNEVENYDDDDNEVENDDDDDCVVENDDDNEVENENDLITVLRTIRGRSPSPSTRPRRKMASVSETRSSLLSSGKLLPSMPFLLILTDVAVVVIVVALIGGDDNC